MDVEKKGYSWEKRTNCIYLACGIYRHKKNYMIDQLIVFYKSKMLWFWTRDGAFDFELLISTLKASVITITN